MHSAVTFPAFLLALVLAVAFALAMVRGRVLTPGGSVVAALIGLTVIIGQGWSWLLPLVLFLGTGVLLGWLNSGARTDAKHGKPRDAMQVFCSGGIYALLALNQEFSREAIWMSISICIATCDTWASEIGMYAKWPTWNILTLRKVQPGFSGGVSIAGTLGGVLGAVLMVVLCSWLSAPSEPHRNIFTSSLMFGIHSIAVGVLLAFALAGMLLDSVLGSLLQAKYDDGAGPQDSGTRRVSGLRWMTNDVVNLLSNAVIVGAAMWML